MLDGCSRFSDLGHEFAPNFLRAEVDYLIHNEYVMCAEDAIWRRTRQGIRMDSTQILMLDDYIQSVLHGESDNEETINARLHR